MGFGKQFTKFCTAIVFLLAILVQPIHQLEHLSHLSENQHLPHADLSFQNHHETHCNLCDFTFFPQTEWAVNLFEIPFDVDFVEKKNEAVHSGLNVFKFNSHKQLRAPPFQT